MNTDRVDDDSQQYGGEDIGCISFIFLIIILIIAICVFG
jgi:hypothetical protein